RAEERQIKNRLLRFLLVTAGTLAVPAVSFATTKGLSQIVTPDLEDEGDLSLSFQLQDEYIGNPYEIQAELGVTNWFELALFKGFKPDDYILGTEIGIIQKKPWLLSIGAVNWSPKYG